MIFDIVGRQIVGCSRLSDGFYGVATNVTSRLKNTTGCSHDWPALLSIWRNANVNSELPAEKSPRIGLSAPPETWLTARHACAPPSRRFPKANWPRCAHRARRSIPRVPRCRADLTPSWRMLAVRGMKSRVMVSCISHFRSPVLGFAWRCDSHPYHPLRNAFRKLV
jgi:hypothetical protein